MSTTARKPASIPADSRPVLAFTVILVTVVAVGAFALSFSSLRAAASWGRVPETITFLVPVVIDASVLAYGLVALVLRARGRSSAWAWTLMFLFTAVSTGANAAHAYGVSESVQVLVGVVLVALAPFSVLTTTHALASLVVEHGPAAFAEDLRSFVEPIFVEPVVETSTPAAPIIAEAPTPAPLLVSVAQDVPARTDEPRVVVEKAPRRASKITDEIRAEVARRRAEGEKPDDIAADLGIGRASAYRIPAAVAA